MSSYLCFPHSIHSHIYISVGPLLQALGVGCIEIFILVVIIMYLQPVQPYGCMEYQRGQTSWQATMVARLCQNSTH